MGRRTAIHLEECGWAQSHRQGPHTDKVRTNPVSRAWHRTVSWLRDLTSNRPPATTNAAKWNLLNYQHDLTVNDPHLQADAAAFKAWNRLLTPLAPSPPQQSARYVIAVVCVYTASWCVAMRGGRAGGTQG